MADILFLLAGIVILFKREVRISQTRVLSGRSVKILTFLYFLPFASGFVGGIIAGVTGEPLALGGLFSAVFSVIAILATLYLIFCYKGGK